MKCRKTNQRIEEGERKQEEKEDEVRQLEMQRSYEKKQKINKSE